MGTSKGMKGSEGWRGERHSGEIGTGKDRKKCNSRCKEQEKEGIERGREDVKGKGRME